MILFKLPSIEISSFESKLSDLSYFQISPHRKHSHLVDARLALQVQVSVLLGSDAHVGDHLGDRVVVLVAAVGAGPLRDAAPAPQRLRGPSGPGRAPRSWTTPTHRI